MKELKDYFNYDYLNNLATDENIYYSPSIGWDKISSKKVNASKKEILDKISEKVLRGQLFFCSI